ncbi:MAG: metalloregulator ArsR/SmtB family transcription factor [Actinomycetota bacterium]
MDAAARALAEPIRREILGLVRDRERTVSDIAEHFEVSRPAVSQHLRVLSEAELVTVRSEGTRRFYTARPEGLAELREWMSGFWQSSLQDLETEIERDRWNERKRSRKRPDRKDKA